MSRVTTANPWMPVEELKALLKRTGDRRTAQRMLVVLSATVEPKPAKDIAAHVGVATQTVHNWMATYNRFGPDALFEKKPRKPSPRLLSDEEERSVIEPFVKKAVQGQVSTAAEIKRTIEEDILGFTIHHSTVYRLLARYEWRKIKPRPAHPLADPQAQEDFKKNS